jgi:hypothetical protein
MVQKDYCGMSVIMKNEINKKVKEKLMKKLILNSLLVCAAFMTVSANAVNLLVDPGFEANPLTTAVAVFNTPNPMLPGVWGQENSTIVGAEFTVTPPQGVKMLRMDNTGSYTQTFQATDVTSYAALIDSGGATVNLSALFNANPKIGAALGGIGVAFCTTSNYSSYTGSISNSLTLDNSPNTWQSISKSGIIPPGTRWLMSQVYFQDASLQGVPPDMSYYGGYVDAADLTITPEPATMCLLGLGGLVMRYKKRNSVR